MVTEGRKDFIATLNDKDRTRLSVYVYEDQKKAEVSGQKEIFEGTSVVAEVGKPLLLKDGEHVVFESKSPVASYKEYEEPEISATHLN